MIVIFQQKSLYKIARDCNPGNISNHNLIQEVQVYRVCWYIGLSIGNTAQPPNVLYSKLKLANGKTHQEVVLVVYCAYMHVGDALKPPWPLLYTHAFSHTLHYYTDS